MKYVCVSYETVPTCNSQNAQILVFSDSDVTNKFVIGDQLFITCNGKTYAVQYNSANESNITDFATVFRVAYQGVKAYSN